jgi:hypothetical protein
MNMFSRNRLWIAAALFAVAAVAIPLVCRRPSPRDPAGLPPGSRRSLFARPTANLFIFERLRRGLGVG